MEAESVENRLRKTWRALAEAAPSGVGWQTIALSTENGHLFRAGVQFPEKNEAVLVHFDLAEIPEDIALPSGKGFYLVNAGPLEGHSGLWVALCRQPAGDAGMFLRMAADVLNVCSSAPEGRKAEQELRIFVSRIAAWQNFMKRAGRQLSVPQQMGLCGELEIFHDLLEAGVGPLSVLSSWQGPTDGLHDFVLPSGALEVKSTAMPDKIWISSAEQLDISIMNPLFLAVINFAVDRDRGKTLAEYIDKIRQKIWSNFSARQIFDSLLLEMGIVIDNSSTNKYEKFTLNSKSFFEISTDFPALNRSNLPSEVVDIKYCLNTENLSKFSTSLTTILEKSGAC